MANEKYKLIITFLLSYSSIFHLGAWRNSIELFKKKGYIINLIQFSDENIGLNRGELEAEYNLIQIPYPFVVKAIIFIIKYFFRTLQKVGLHKFSQIGDGIDYLIKNTYFVLFAILRLIKVDSDYYIAGDSPSLSAAYILSRKDYRKLVFWELELTIEKELPNFGQQLFKKIEKRCSKKAACAIEFGDKRAELLRRENAIPEQTPILSIPNSRLGIPRNERNYYFNDKFNISKEKKIILYAGGIFSKYCGIDTLWDSIELWPDSTIFIIHSREKPNLSQRSFIAKMMKKSAGRFITHNEPLPFEMLSNVYASCDIGLIPIRIPEKINYSNIYYSELSLGKLFQFTYYGIPVITSRLFGYKELIEQNGVGFCFDNPMEIGLLIKKILDNDKYYRENCISFSKKYGFENYHSAFEKIISAKK